MNKLTIFWLCQGEEKPQFGIVMHNICDINYVDANDWEVTLTNGVVYTLQGDDLKRFKLLIDEAK